MLSNSNRQFFKLKKNERFKKEKIHPKIDGKEISNKFEIETLASVSNLFLYKRDFGCLIKNFFFKRNNDLQNVVNYRTLLKILPFFLINHLIYMRKQFPKALKFDQFFFFFYSIKNHHFFFLKGHNKKIKNQFYSFFLH